MKITQETKKLHEEKAALVTSMQAITNKAVAEGSRALTTEEDAKFDELDAKLILVEKSIEKISRAYALTANEEERLLSEKEKTGKSVDELKDREKRQTRTFAKYILSGASSLNEEERKIMTRIQTEGTTTEGGYLVPTSIMTEYDAALLAYGGVRGVSRVIKTAQGNDLTWPNFDDTANKSSIVAENVDISTGTAMVFGSTTLKAFMYKTGVLQASKQLLADAAFDVSKLIGEALAMRDARGLNTAFTTGGGSTSAPEGVVTASGSGVTTASETAFTANEIVDLEHSVDPEYRRNAKFMLHDSILKAIKKLTFSTSDNRPLWDPAILRMGTPATILGYEYVINQDMASIPVADAKVMLFGDFSKYVIRDVQDFQVTTLFERYAEYLVVGYFGTSRHDGRKVTGSSVYPWKRMTMVNT